MLDRMSRTTAGLMIASKNTKRKRCKSLYWKALPTAAAKLRKVGTLSRSGYRRDLPKSGREPATTLVGERTDWTTNLTTND